MLVFAWKVTFYYLSIIRYRLRIAKIALLNVYATPTFYRVLYCNVPYRYLAALTTVCSDLTTFKALAYSYSRLTLKY